MTELSAELQSFVAEAPLMRQPHVAFLQRAASSLADGAVVLDVGAGDAPYRELFAPVDYRTCDRPDSIYRPGREPDIRASADAIPLADGTLDAVICTQVLEHVAEPLAVLLEFRRLLRPGGRLWLTAPLVWYQHEEPHDYYRYTSHGLHFLLGKAGFEDVELAPLSDSFATLAQLLDHLGWMAGRTGDGFDDQRDLVGQVMSRLSEVVSSFANFDTRWILPLGYSAIGTAPAPS